MIKYFSILLWTKQNSCRSPAPGTKAVLCPFRQSKVEALPGWLQEHSKLPLSPATLQTAQLLQKLLGRTGRGSVPHLLLFFLMFYWLQWTFSQMHSRQRRRILTFCLQQLCGPGIWTDCSTSTAQLACVLHMLEIHPLQHWNALWHHNSPKESCGEVAENNLSYPPGTAEKGTFVHRRFWWSWRNNLFPTKPSSMIHL